MNEHYSRGAWKIENNRIQSIPYYYQYENNDIQLILQHKHNSEYIKLEYTSPALPPTIPRHVTKMLHLAASNARNVLTATVGLTTGDLNARPGPVRATAATADNGNVVTGRGDSAGAGDVLDGEVGDGDAAGGVALQVTAVVVLLDEDTVPGSC